MGIKSVKYNIAFVYSSRRRAVTRHPAIFSAVREPAAIFSPPSAETIQTRVGSKTLPRFSGETLDVRASSCVCLAHVSSALSMSRSIGDSPCAKKARVVNHGTQSTTRVRTRETKTGKRNCRAVSRMVINPALMNPPTPPSRSPPSALPRCTNTTDA